MLRALWDAGVTPDVLVGGSVGAINACFVGSHPTADGVEKLAAHWLDMSESALCGSRRDAVLNVARRRPYLFSSDRLRRLASTWVPTYHLENLAVPVVVATTDIATGRAVHHDHGYIPDLLAASAALPAIFPPVVLRGPHGPATHVDAGVAENVPALGRRGGGTGRRPGLGAGRDARPHERRAPCAARSTSLSRHSAPRCATGRSRPSRPASSGALQARRRPSTAARSSTSRTPASSSSSVRGLPRPPSRQPPHRHRPRHRPSPAPSVELVA